MRVKRFSTGLRATLLAIFTVTVFVTGTLAATEKVLHNFQSNFRDGFNPDAGLIFDGSGNLYGTTFYGGAYGAGRVFELTPAKGGGWTEKVLHNFGKGMDGFYPYAGLVFDSSGNLYGTTQSGGAYNYGTAFELTPKAGGGWTEKVLHSFNYPNAATPWAGLTVDSSGNLYGTTRSSGAYGVGTVFELTPKAGGGWREKVLHNFNGSNGKDGASPVAGLILDSSGNLYGTTSEGGAYVYGTVFELTPKAGGGWTEKVLHSFGGMGDGISPYAGLIFDSSGNLYGTTSSGGSDGYGAVFELTPKADGGWTEKLLHSFIVNGKNDGYSPVSGLVFDSSGNLYGTTQSGGAYYVGTVFELTPKVGGGWTEKIVHNFDSNNHKDGYSPIAGLIIDATGNLFGTTYSGGTYGYGTVFEIKP